MPDGKSIANKLRGEMPAHLGYFPSKMVAFASLKLAWSIMLCPLAELEL